MIRIGVQTKNIVFDDNPLLGYEIIKKTGFSCTDFSLNSYLTNTDLYNFKINNFFDKSIEELQQYFLPHKKALKETKIIVNQMHMPYPIFIPNGNEDINNYLQNVVAVKSLEVCKFFECHNIVIHGFKLLKSVGSEKEEWKYTEKFLEALAPIAKQYEITICLENIYRKEGSNIIEGPCCNVQKVIQRIDRLNDKYGEGIFGFCFDTGHANLVGTDFEKFITTLGDRLKVLHIHDNDGIKDLHQIPFTFSKNRENHCSTDWTGFINGLKNIKFNGVLNFETAPVLTSFPLELKLETLEFISKIGKYFASEIEK